MNGSYSLRRRLALGLAFGISTMWLAGVLVAGLVVRHELDEAFDSALQETTQRLLSLAATDILNHDSQDGGRQIAPLRAHDEFLTYIVRDQFGTIVLRSHDANPGVFPERPQSGFIDTETHRIYGEATISETLFLEVAEPLAHRREATLETTLSLVVPLGLFLPICVLGVWWMVRRSMQPVVGLRIQIEARSAGDLSAIAVEGLPDEIAPIADAVNRLMDRIHSSLEAERSFTANSAHELRTPIAGALAQTQRLMAVLGDMTLRKRVGDIEASLHRLARISEKLMQLARAEGGGVIAQKEGDLGPILDAVIDEFARGPDGEARLRYTAPTAGCLVGRLDPDAFGILMRNIIENAFKHSPADSVIEVLTGSGKVRVINAGEIVSPDALATLTKPFVRGQSGVEGSGLGLAIAAMIASNGNIGLEFRSPATDQTSGFEVEITL